MNKQFKVISSNLSNIDFIKNMKLKGLMKKIWLNSWKNIGKYF